MEIFKTIISFVMATFGGWMMLRGKKLMDTKMIVWGGILIILSYWLFSIGGNDDASKAAIKKLMPSATEQQQPQP